MLRNIITKTICDFIQQSKDKNCYDEPLVGFANACDPIFMNYKEIIGDFHLTPQEIFEAEFGNGSFVEGTVICWVLPITKEVRDSNRKEKSLPSREWA
ncbi:MAG: epoxyqueuosine reductase, partial [Bacillota bacterium]|nr:epoxyqueuosine reductase [Bacillota bacterium]